MMLKTFEKNCCTILTILTRLENFCTIFTRLENFCRILTRLEKLLHDAKNFWKTKTVAQYSGYSHCESHKVGKLLHKTQKIGKLLQDTHKVGKLFA